MKYGNGDSVDDKYRLVYLNLMVCPSNPPLTRSTNATPNAYVVNTGKEEDRNKIQWGICHDQFTDPKIRISLDYISQNDGASTTLLMSEKAPLAGRDFGAATDGAGDWDIVSDDAYKRIGFVWHNAAPSSGLRVREHLSSYHSGGVVSYFADGHFQFLRDTIDYSVYQALMTPNGRSRNETPISDANF